MADRYFKVLNGQNIEMTENEIDQIKAENQKKLLEQLQYDVINNEDLINIILSQYTIQLPDDTTRPATGANKIVDLPLKLGQKWDLVLNGDTFMYQLVDNPDAVGTSEENYIVYYDGVPLIDNAFYKKDGIIQVYMAGQWAEW